jgi:hydrogenase maturation protease
VALPKESTVQSHIVVIGVGNEYRGDDGLGPCVAREMRRRGLTGVRIVEESGEGASLMRAWQGTDCVFIVDAMSSGEPPGSFHRFDVSTSGLPKHSFHYSSHAFGLVEGIEMARQLKQLPAMMIVYGIVGESFDPGVGLSDPVVRAVPELITMIEHDIRTAIQ